MNVFGLSITRARPPSDLMPVDNRGGWWGLVREGFTGAWQSNIEIRLDTVLTYHAVYACISLIASDISKMRMKLVAEDANGIWSETPSSALSPVLRRPNHYQNRIKFFEQWVTSKLIYGNTYVLKVRDARNVITQLYILDPNRTKVLVSPDGSVFYQLSRDDLTGLDEDLVAVPAREIIHDLMCPLYHPLVGVSPIYACGLAAVQGLKIQTNSTQFFGNGSNPGGILTAPGAISDETAARLKAHWDANYTGQNVGKVAVLGDGLKYEAMAITATDSQLIEQLRWTAEVVCSCFHVPPYMIGIGPAPSYTNIEALNQQYYTQCLQSLIENIELCLDEGLELPKPYGTEFDLDALLRMDTATQYKAISDGIGGSFLTPNEGRRKLDLPPLEGGDTVYMQQQNFSLAALNERDQDAPFAKPTAAPAATPAPTAEPDPDEVDDNPAEDPSIAANANAYGTSGCRTLSSAPRCRVPRGSRAGTGATARKAPRARLARVASPARLDLLALKANRVRLARSALLVIPARLAPLANPDPLARLACQGRPARPVTLAPPASRERRARTGQTSTPRRSGRWSPLASLPAWPSSRKMSAPIRWAISRAAWRPSDPVRRSRSIAQWRRPWRRSCGP